MSSPYAESKAALPRRPQRHLDPLLQGRGIDQGQIGVDLAHGAHRRRQRLARLAVAADVEGRPGSVMLLQGQVEIRAGLFPQLDVFGVLGQAHYGKGIRVGIAEAASQGILAWPHRAGHGLIDNGDRKGALTVPGAKSPACQDGNAHGLRIAGRDPVVHHQMGFVLGRTLGVDVADKVTVRGATSASAADWTPGRL